MKFLLASLKTHTNSKKCSVSRIKFLFRLSFALIGKFFPVYIHSRLLEQFSGSQAGYGTTFWDTGGSQKARTSSLKRVTGRNFTISIWFHRSKQKLWLNFLHRKTTKNYKTISAQSKSNVLIFRNKSSSRHVILSL
jgi:hypothetical protein